PLIEVNGAASPGDGFDANKPLVIQGLTINRFPGDAITLFPGSGGSTVLGNYIGTDSGGTQDLGNSGGVGVFSSGNTIGGSSASVRNVISGNNGFGVYLENGGSNNTVTGN